MVLQSPRNKIKQKKVIILRTLLAYHLSWGMFDLDKLFDNVTTRQLMTSLQCHYITDMPPPSISSAMHPQLITPPTLTLDFGVKLKVTISVIVIYVSVLHVCYHYQPVCTNIFQ